MTVMIIDAINACLRLFVLLIVVEFALDFFCMSLVCFIVRPLDVVGKRCVCCRSLPVVGDDGWSARVALTVGHFRLSVKTASKRASPGRHVLALLDV